MPFAELGSLTSHELNADPIVLAAAGLLAFGVVATGLAERLRIPTLLVFLALGMLVADDGLALIRFDDADLAQNLGVVALVVILFEGGLSTPWKDARRVVMPAASLAIVGVLITAGVVAGSLILLFDTPTNTALLIGAVVASTDAAAVFATLRRLPLPRRLAATVELESGFNDPMAVLLTIGFVESARNDIGIADWAIFGVQQLGVGGVLGVAFGFAGAWACARLPAPTPALRAVFAAAVGAAAYGTTALAGGSGFLAVYLAGLVLRHRLGPECDTIREFHEALAAIAQVGLFFLLGILVFPSQLGDVVGEAAVTAVVLALVARPLAAVVSLAPFRWPAREIAFVSWAGLRGGVPIVLATFPLTDGRSDGQLVFDGVFFVVLVSTLFQATTLVPLARWLGIGADPPPGDAPVPDRTMPPR